MCNTGKAREETYIVISKEKKKKGEEKIIYKSNR